MPGIAGIIENIEHEMHIEAIDEMIKCMMHEQFYTSGVYVNKRLGLLSGWVNHKDSFSDCMPIWNETHDVCLIFSGENYIEPAEINSLRQKGHAISDTTNASYIVHQYEEAGNSFIEKLNGIFCGFVVDLRESKIILFNDRYGLGRIYYHESMDSFYFASEAKSLLRVLPHLRNLDMISFGEFFACGSALQNRTLFSGVSLLPPGSLWTFRPNQGVKKEKYFRKEIWESQITLSKSDYYEKLKETFTRILPKYFHSKCGIALSLTGGIDSRIVIALAQREPFSLPCYTFGGLYRECADVRVARKVAKLCLQNHEVISLTHEFFNEFPSLAERSVYITDGAMDVSGSVGLFVNRIARNVAPIRLTGNYGGEILRGLVVFKFEHAFNSMFNKEFVDNINKAHTNFSVERRCHQKTYIIFKQVPWHHYNRFCLEQSQLTIRSPYLDNELVAISYQAPADLSVNKAFAFRLIAESNASVSELPTDRGIASRTSLIPFKIRQWIEEFMPRAEYVYDYGMPQWLAKIDFYLTPLHIERFFLGRQKYYHFRTWYQNELSDYVKEVLLDQRTLSRPYINKRYVEKAVISHMKGFGNYTLEIHKLLTSELVQRQLIEQL